MEANGEVFEERIQEAAEESAARTPELLEFRVATGVLSLPEGAERVSRAAARLCERPRFLPTRATAPAGPENQGSPTEERSCAPHGAGRCFWRDRWRRSRGSLADRLAIGGPAGPGRQAGCLPHFQAGRDACASKISSRATAIPGSCQCTKCPVSLPRSSHPPKLARSREGRVD